MSRSFHSNIREFLKAKSYKYSNEDTKEKNIERIREELYRKRITKKSTILNRSMDFKQINYNKLFNPNSIEIRILDQGDYVHYPATKEDILGVIKMLPCNVAAGIHSITLCLGKEYQENKVDDPEEEIRDPYTARICTDEEGPVYMSPSLGTYYTDTCKIFIYAYVYNKKELKLNIIEPFLKLQMLSTLIHEIAHHEDNILRTSRGRWLGFNDWKCEDFAELKQMKWSETAIVPYLMNTYPEEYNDLSSWIEKFGGVRFPLAKLAGESKGRRIGDRVKVVFCASDSILDLFNNIINCMNERDAMLQFAKDLHYGEYYEECLKALETLLSNNLCDSDALGVKADTYIHQEKYDDAEKTAEECLLIDKENIDALEAICDVKQYRKDWNGLKHISKIGILAAKDDTFSVRNFAEFYIIALLYLKEYQEAENYVRTLPDNVMHYQRKAAFEALVRFCSGDIVNALIIAKDMLSHEKVISSAKVILKAIFNSSILLQGENIDMYELNRYEKNYLENTDINGLIN